ncbi:MerR family transcriptional regulator [Cellulomonas oligotrophica]|uniref:DNA-binding transcriptional MerR regulator n=1 Tax=Cellulomonas oligotrophica TaxID=931536 RepID=A0A7Y9FHW1_9CELL|nr:MerR family transcriptional regulator [Cellulomonas oligotrophica]NYD86236.1 DNA-binding transcriptional MerR regulator [Cellulomonas oligotrophica]GIG34437.1 hypothetical protein Col01nite_35960 [Cellulomonas oligotrophica]
MHDDLLSIGAFARAGGLPVSALRFYDAAGVLRPVHVDRATGYRWYAPAQVGTARLVASLRQAGLPVPDLVAVLAAPDAAGTVLDRHRGRLEADLAAATRHLEAARALLLRTARGTVDAADLVRAVTAVRHAVAATDSTWPGLTGVLLHLDGPTLRLVGCDRHRLALATVPVRDPSGPPVRVVAPLPLVDALVTAAPSGAGPITLGTHVVDVLGLTSEPVAAPYPDYAPLLAPPQARASTVGSDALVASASAAGDVLVVRLDHDDVRLTAPGPRDVLGYSRTFVLDAVRAAHAEHVTLAVEGDRSVLRVTATHRAQDASLVMPIRLQERRTAA